MNKIKEAFAPIAFDDETKEHILRHIVSATPKKPAQVRYLFAAAALVVALAAIYIPLIFAENTAPGYRPDIPLAGLPVDNFSLAGLPSNPLASRMAHYRLSSFFGYGVPDMFVFARVAEVGKWEDDSSILGWNLWQASTLDILSVLWLRDGPMPGRSMQVIQSLYLPRYMGLDKSNMLREGGVYLLPLRYWEARERWSVVGDLDVLFEVDDMGLVWTHSAFEGFSRFDGRDATVLADAILAIALDENYPAAATPFGNSIASWGVLAGVTVLSAEPAADQWGKDICEYRLRIDSLLLNAEPYDWDYPPWRPERGVYSVVSYDTASPLVPDGRYLMLLDGTSRENELHIGDSFVAKVHDDGTITALPSPWGNVFDGFDGYTVRQMKEEAERARAWHKKHVKRD